MKYHRKKDKDMNTVISNNLSLSDFIQQNKDRLYKEGRRNTKLNNDNKPTISRRDPWFNENEWDDHFNGMKNK